jgi:VanZ family protein
MFYRFNFYPFMWALCIFGLNLVRADGIPSHHLVSFLYFDKLAHFLEFCLLSFILCVGLSKQHTYIAIRFTALKTSLIVCLVYALVLAVIHLFIAKEYFEIADLLAAFLGCFIGCGIFYLIYLYKSEN